MTLKTYATTIAALTVLRDFFGTGQSAEDITNAIAEIKILKNENVISVNEIKSQQIKENRLV